MIINIAICTFMFSLFIIFDLMPIYYDKQWKEFWIYSALIATAFIIHILVAMNISIPSPATPIKALVIYIFGLKE